MQTGVNGETRLYMASLSFSNVYYILRKSANTATARLSLARFEKLVTILTVDAQTIQQALTSSSADFEDGIQHFAALSEPAISAIITRDAKDFQSSQLPILSPARALLEI